MFRRPLPRSTLIPYTTLFRSGTITDQRAILTRLAELQYTRNEIGFSRGTFRVRGDVIDIFPADSDELAVRVELFDDEVDRIVMFDPLTGSAVNEVSRITIYPKTHYVTPRNIMDNAIAQIKQELKERQKALLDNNRLLEEQQIGRASCRERV